MTRKLGLLAELDIFATDFWCVLQGSLLVAQELAAPGLCPPLAKSRSNESAIAVIRISSVSGQSKLALLHGAYCNKPKLNQIEGESKSLASWFLRARCYSCSVAAI